MGLGEIPPIFTRISLQDQTSNIGLIAQTIEDHMTNAQISHSIEVMETDHEMNLSKSEWKLAKQWKLFSFPLDSKKKLLTK